MYGIRSRSRPSSISRLCAFMRKSTATRPPARKAAVRSVTQAASSNSSDASCSRTSSPAPFTATSVLPLRRSFRATSAPAASRMRWLER